MSDSDRIIRLPDVVAPVTHVRSTLIQLSLTQLRERGHFEAYEEHLSDADRSELVSSSAPSWLRVELAAAHYQACDSLELSQSELLRMGEGVGARLGSTLMGVLARAAKLAGITPWQFYGQLGRVWPRAFQGGAVGLTRVGPMESMIEVSGLPLCRFEYFRHACCGVFTSIAKLAAARASTSLVEHGPDRLRMRGTWSDRSSGPL